MATLLLQAAGSYLGGLFGAAGATIGAAAGAYGGYLIDQALINSSKRIQGQRLSSPQALSGEDGAPLARIYGTMRQGGTLIWATRFEEASKTERQGGKGSGPKVTTFTYFANFAVAICEGEIAHIRRVWADGKELDLTENTVRIYRGTNDQLPDPLIEAKQGAGNAPAYRGTAYAVFDRLALANFGNRIPQMQFEVIRTSGGITSDIQAITIIPGSTEFGLAPQRVAQTIQEGETEIANRHVLYAGSDFEASIDELQALCPNLKRVALVVAWFGNDLRAGQCLVRPKVSNANSYQNDSWRVAGLTRGTAQVVSQFEGRAAYGGTPDDDSVIAAISNLKARGLKVTLYPFVLMDIPNTNALPSPYGGAMQSAYPWRGEISCTPAPGISGSVDGTAIAGTQVASFAGSAVPSAFGAAGNSVTFSGGVDWGYRRFILHYAKLASIAGGVDAFLVGSEFRGLTRVRAGGAFPFVSVLSGLASDVRAMLGAQTKLSYGADWSEYGAYSPPGTNDLYFHLDPLWANPAINAVGIDNYMPLSDWRDGDVGGDNPDGAGSANDGEALERAVETGEGYDWFYASATNRANRVRSPIQDSAAGKPWVYRFKDLRGWWENQHYNRVNGVEVATPTAWVPRGKPLWFTELGSPAIDKAANQPNVFPDAKSSSAAIPYYSNGNRDDEAQTRFLEAHFKHWAKAANNPMSTQYAGRMLDLENNYLWAWDARPFPAFPLAGTVWGDGNNWLTGHWLNGRLSNIALQDLVAAICLEHGVSDIDVSKLDGVLSGYMLDRPTSIREALDAVLALYRVNISERAGTLHIQSRDRALPKAKLIGALALNADDETLVENLESNIETPDELILEFRDILRDHQQATVTSRLTSSGRSLQSIGLPAAIDSGQANSQLRQFHRAQSAAVRTVNFQTGWADMGLEVGDVVALETGGTNYRIKKITDTKQRQIEAEQVLAVSVPSGRAALRETSTLALQVVGPPLSIFLDLPYLPYAVDGGGGLRVAAWSKPWSPMLALASAASDGFVQKAALSEPAITGRLANALPPGQAARVVTRDWIDVDIAQGGLATLTDLALLNGGNAAAVLNANGAWEVIQFGKVVEISAGRWRLSRLLRGQLGTIDAMDAGAAIGARFVLLDAAVKRCNLTSGEAESALNWKVGPVGKEMTANYFAAQTVPAATRSTKANAPVHLKAKKRANGDFSIDWKRCGSLNADSWEGTDIPLAEPSETYAIVVRGTDQSVKRQLTVNANAWTYVAAQRFADFGAGAPGGFIEIAQTSANGLPGLKRQLSLAF